jgi:hypothetical protein
LVTCRWSCHTSGFTKYRKRALDLVSRLCVRNASKLLVAINDWLQADGPDKWRRYAYPGLPTPTTIVRP